MAKLPSTNIDNYLVARTIGVGSSDVGTLCESDNINKNSRYKPIALDVDKDTPQPITIETLKNYVYGLSIPMITLPQTLGLGNYSVDTEWVYNKPRAGVNWHRLSDFANYNHQSVHVVTKKMAHENSTMWQTVTFNFNQVADNGLVPSNINPKKWTSTNINTGDTFADMYVGIAFYKQREDDDEVGDFSGIVVSDSKVGANASLTVGFSTSNLLGTVYYLLFFCPSKPTSTSTFPNAFIIYPLDGGFGSTHYSRIWIDVDLWGVPNWVETEFYEIGNSHGVSMDDQYIEFDPIGSDAVYFSLSPRNVATGLDTNSVRQRKIVFNDVVTSNSPDVLDNDPTLNYIPKEGQNYIFPLFDGIWDADNDSYVLTWKVTSDGVFSLYLWDVVSETRGNDIINFSMDLGTGDNQGIINDLSIANIVGTGAGAAVEGVYVAVNYTEKGNSYSRTAILSGYKIAYNDQYQYQELPVYTFGKAIGNTHGSTTNYHKLQIHISINPAY